MARNDHPEARMRIIVCGGRAYDNVERVASVLNEYRNVRPHIIVGSRGGADGLALRYAMAHNWPHTVTPAEWSIGRIAGPLRNEEMATAGADLCIAFPGGRGTADMKRRARVHGIEVRVVDPPENFTAGKHATHSD